MVIDSLLNYRLDGQVFIKFGGRQHNGIIAQNRGIEISGKEFHGLVDYFIGKKRADNTKFNTNFTVFAVCIVQCFYLFSLFLQNNNIKTSKYTLLTFLPLNLFEQFQRLANFYFACLLILQLIDVISSLTPVTTAVPLVGVLTLIAIKDGYDDIVSIINFGQIWPIVVIVGQIIIILF